MTFYLMYLLAIICSHQLPSSLRGLKCGLRFYLHPFSAVAIANALARLRVCSDTSEASLIEYAN